MSPSIAVAKRNAHCSRLAGTCKASHSSSIRPAASVLISKRLRKGSTPPRLPVLLSIPVSARNLPTRQLNVGCAAPVTDDAILIALLGGAEHLGVFVKHTDFIVLGGSHDQVSATRSARAGRTFHTYFHRGTRLCYTDSSLLHFVRRCYSCAPRTTQLLLYSTSDSRRFACRMDSSTEEGLARTSRK